MRKTLSSSLNKSRIAVFGDLYNSSLDSYIARVMIRYYGLKAINTEKSNLVYDPKIDAARTTPDKVDHVIYAANFDELGYIRNTKHSIILLKEPAQKHLFTLKGFNNVITFNPLYYKLLKDVGLTNTVLIKAPILECTKETKKIVNTSKFILGLLEPRIDIVEKLLKNIDRDLDVGILIPSSNATQASQYVANLKHKNNSTVTFYLFNMDYTQQEISNVFASSHFVVDSTGFFSNFSISRGLYYTSSMLDFKNTFDKVYRAFHRNQMVQKFEQIEGKSLEYIL